MIAPALSAVAPEAPGRLGSAVVAEDALRYLDALGQWRDARRAELDRLDEAALHAPDADALTPDILLSMALWKAVADRHDLLLATWDSGRVGPAERERMSTLIWGRLDSTIDPALAARAGAAGPSGALAVSLPEACRLSDALASSLRVRLALDPAEADVTARVRQLRAQVERVRDLVEREPARTREDAQRRLAKLDRRVGDVAERAKRGADVGGLLGPLEGDAARSERDLIVGAATRLEAARDAKRAHALRAELAARGAAVRALAALCVAAVSPAPRLAVPDVAALGPVPEEAGAVDAYLLRLDAVSRALTQAHTAYQAGLDERAELSLRLQGYAAKAARAGGTDPALAGDLGDLHHRGQETLGREPTDLTRLRALVGAYQAYLAAIPAVPAVPAVPAPSTPGGTR